MSTLKAETPAHDDVTSQLQEALAALDRALAAPAARLKAETHEALQSVVRLRDLLIERHRRAATPEDRVAERAALDHVNVALSLMIGVEYPIEKVQREPLEQAKGVLQGLVAAGQV